MIHWVFPGFLFNIFWLSSIYSILYSIDLFDQPSAPMLQTTPQQSQRNSRSRRWATPLQSSGPRDGPPQNQSLLFNHVENPSHASFLSSQLCCSTSTLRSLFVFPKSSERKHVPLLERNDNKETLGLHHQPEILVHSLLPPKRMTTNRAELPLARLPSGELVKVKVSASEVFVPYLCWEDSGVASVLEVSRTPTAHSIHPKPTKSQGV